MNHYGHLEYNQINIIASEHVEPRLNSGILSDLWVLNVHKFCACDTAGNSLSLIIHRARDYFPTIYVYISLVIQYCNTQLRS